MPSATQGDTASIIYAFVGLFALLLFVLGYVLYVIHLQRRNQSRHPSISTLSAVPVPLESNERPGVPPCQQYVVEKPSDPFLTGFCLGREKHAS